MLPFVTERVHFLANHMTGLLLCQALIGQISSQSCDRIGPIQCSYKSNLQTRGLYLLYLISTILWPYLILQTYYVHFLANRVAGLHHALLLFVQFLANHVAGLFLCYALIGLISSQSCGLIVPLQCSYSSNLQTRYLYLLYLLNYGLT